jgi:prepilin-type N-terminal cleavage/methylation domain-containing protein
MQKKSSGFTLIELLIVVAIIAILAAIAVPNFLEAQTRAKVSRVKSDMRTIATAVEAYAVDENKPPREYSTTTGNAGYSDPQIEGQEVGGIMGPWLSTPIAYLTQGFLFDPFVDRQNSIPFDERSYTYQDLRHRVRPDTNTVRGPFFTNGLFKAAVVDFYGSWRLGSVGPDRNFAHGFTNSAQLVYDPTNGTVSNGNLWRSQKTSDSAQPPVGPLISAH